MRPDRDVMQTFAPRFYPGDVVISENIQYIRSADGYCGGRRILFLQPRMVAGR